MIIDMHFEGDPEKIRDILESWLKSGHMKSCGGGGGSEATSFWIKVGTKLPEPPLSDEELSKIRKMLP